MWTGNQGNQGQLWSITPKKQYGQILQKEEKGR